MDEENRSEIIEDIAKRLRDTELEYPGSLDLKKTVILTTYADLGETVCGFRHIYVPGGMAGPLLGNIDSYQAAMEFADQ